jgi:hypothetical protein
MTVTVMRRFFCALILTLGFVQGARAEPSDKTTGDWGIDGCLTCHVPGEEDFLAYVRLLQKSGVKWVRERQVAGNSNKDDKGQVSGPLVSRLRAMQAAGLHVVAFASAPDAHVDQPGNQLPEDLRAVYASSFRQGRDYAGLVDVWEMQGEPDVGYCRDLPDRLAAYNKAVYLGLHDGAASAGKRTIVVMGALALPPGPWLERAMANGLLDYTDAYNFHFYGYASDLAGVIAAHRVVVKRAFPSSVSSVRRHGRPGAMFSENLKTDSPLALPLWITECGINAVTPADFYNPQRRNLQADFTRETAKTAWESPDVAMFMPFILVHAGDPHAMTVRPDFVLPAWDAYEDYVRRHPWPERPLTKAEVSPERMVMQWLPDNTTTAPHKVAGAYQFITGTPMRGVLRVYNFGAKPFRGRIEAQSPPHVRIESVSLVMTDGGSIKSPELVVPAGGQIELPIVFAPVSRGYFRDKWPATFVSEDGHRSQVVFGLESRFEAGDFMETPLSLKSAGDYFPEKKEAVLGNPSGPWMPINGLEVTSSGDEAIFQIQHISQDPLKPTMAVAALDGLPAKGFVRLQLSRPMTSEMQVRVDLVDTKGQCFNIWENFGMSHGHPSTDVWLNLADFNVFFWGRCSADPRLHPSRIREVQLRFYLKQEDNPVMARLSFMTAKSVPPPTAGP